ncbi:MAG: hypothetical protein AAGI66_02730 [Cyanobacteria bacterium P01_H01_bin.74]
MSTTGFQLPQIKFGRAVIPTNAEPETVKLDQVKPTPEMDAPKTVSQIGLGNPETQKKIAEAKTVVADLKALEKKGFDPQKAQPVLNKLGSMFNGIKSAQVELDGKTVDILDAAALAELPAESRIEQLDSLSRSLTARIAATEYNVPIKTTRLIDLPDFFDFSEGKPMQPVKVIEHQYPVHNKNVAYLISYNPNRSSDQIGVILRRLDKLGAFKFPEHKKLGLILTSDTINTVMQRQWHTDSQKVGFVQRDKSPKNWQKVQLINAATYNVPEVLETVVKTVDNPDFYRANTDQMNGIFHIYQPESIAFDKTGTPIVDKIQKDHDWFNQQRLESQALMLEGLAETVVAGATGKEKWGFSAKILSDDKKLDIIAKALVLDARYLKAVNTDTKTGKFDFNTVSASSWEEAGMPNATSDTANTVMAVKALKDLMTNPDYNNNETIQKIRAAVVAEEAKFNQKVSPEKQEDFLSNAEKMDQFITAGRNFVREKVNVPIEQGRMPMQSDVRHPDTSLLLLASTYDKLSDDKIESAELRFKLIHDVTEALSGPNGVRRYNEFEMNGEKIHDSYLNLNYSMPTALREALVGKSQGSNKDFGSGDSGGTQGMVERQKLTTPDSAAEWGLGMSAALQGLAKAKTELLEGVQEKGSVSQNDLDLLKKINEYMNHTINRNLAAFVSSDKAVVRADGSKCPNNVFMEAFEAVTDLNGKVKYMPGQHTLPWHASQVYDGLKNAEAAAELEENLMQAGKLQVKLANSQPFAKAFNFNVAAQPLVSPVAG